MKRIKRFFKTRCAAEQYIATLDTDARFYKAYKCASGKYWVGTEFEWLNRY
jgi:hypothetical protein